FAPATTPCETAFLTRHMNRQVTQRCRRGGNSALRNGNLPLTLRTRRQRSPQPDHREDDHRRQSWRFQKEPLCHDVKFSDSFARVCSCSRSISLAGYHCDDFKSMEIIATGRIDVVLPEPDVTDFP